MRKLELQVSAWGGYVFIINLIPLHVFALILMNRFSNRIYVAYNTFFILGLLCSMQIPFVGFQPVKTSEHMASAGGPIHLKDVFRPLLWTNAFEGSIYIYKGIFLSLR
jgi:asparagine N-glycosylation enzyme membrane subunit Stt3